MLKVPEQYPLVAPNVRFKTKIFHPNVHFKVGTIFAIWLLSDSIFADLCLSYKPEANALQTGEICLDILKNAWSPAWTLQSVCQAIVALMSDSAPDSPLNCDAGNLLRANDIRGYNSLASLYTVEFAKSAKAI